MRRFAMFVPPRMQGDVKAQRALLRYEVEQQGGSVADDAPITTRILKGYFDDVEVLCLEVDVTI